MLGETRQRDDGSVCVWMCICEGRDGHLACVINPGKTPIPLKRKGAETAAWVLCALK